jgi:Na+/proline symporter
MMSAKDERHSFLATLWFTIAHYCVRPWPWILVGLASLVLYPDITDKEAGYVMVMRDYLPPGWRGLLLGAFFAAYMSTIATQLNWGTSYIVNDFYRRFVRRDGTEHHYVWSSRVTTILLMIASAVVTFYLESIRQAWEFVLESGAGIGLVLILRWYWWRVNAWSEISAMVAAAIGFAAVRIFTDLQFPYSLLIVVAGTTVAWLVVTFATRAEPQEHLVAFYRRVRPDGPGWAPIARIAGGPPPGPVRGLLLDWVAGCVLVYATLFGLGSLLFGRYVQGAAWIAAAALAVAIIYRDLSRRGWKSITA